MSKLELGIIKRHPVFSYFILTLAISTGGVFLVIGGFAGIPAKPEQAQKLLPIVVMMMVLGPSLAGIFMTWITQGWGGVTELKSRLLTWRFGLRWYAVALLTAPVMLLVTLLVLSLYSREFLPGIFTAADKQALLLQGIMAGLVAGLFEEIGWTGFAIPELRKRYSVLATGLIVGFVWGLWHYITAFFGSGNAAGELDLALFLAMMVFYVLVLPLFRVVMVWVYDRSRSLVLAMFMHASLTGFVLFILVPQDITPVPLATWYLVFAIALWIVVTTVALAEGKLEEREGRSTPII